MICVKELPRDISIKYSYVTCVCVGELTKKYYRKDDKILYTFPGDDFIINEYINNGGFADTVGIYNGSKVLVFSSNLKRFLSRISSFWDYLFPKDCNMGEAFKMKIWKTAIDYLYYSTYSGDNGESNTDKLFRQKERKSEDIVTRCKGKDIKVMRNGRTLFIDGKRRFISFRSYFSYYIDILFGRKLVLGNIEKIQEYEKKIFQYINDTK